MQHSAYVKNVKTPKTYDIWRPRNKDREAEMYFSRVATLLFAQLLLTSPISPMILPNAIVQSVWTWSKKLLTHCLTTFLMQKAKWGAPILPEMFYWILLAISSVFWRWRLTRHFNMRQRTPLNKTFIKLCLPRLCCRTVSHIIVGYLAFSNQSQVVKWLSILTYIV